MGIDFAGQYSCIDGVGIVGQATGVVVGAGVG
jgi:hypothetical protein